MYSYVLGEALRYGQPMSPGKSKKPKNKKNLRRAIAQKKKK